MPTTKETKVDFLAEFSERHLSGRTVTPVSRFVYQFQGNNDSSGFSSGGYWAVCYKGKAERVILCKTLILNNPHVISEAWLETHKAKFSESDDCLAIKKEFKNFPYFGITPMRVLKRLGQEPQLLSEKGYSILLIGYSGRLALGKASLPPFLSCLAP